MRDVAAGPGPLGARGSAADRAPVARRSASRARAARSGAARDAAPRAPVARDVAGPAAGRVLTCAAAARRRVPADEARP